MLWNVIPLYWCTVKLVLKMSLLFLLYLCIFQENCEQAPLKIELLEYNRIALKGCFFLQVFIFYLSPGTWEFFRTLEPFWLNMDTHVIPSLECIQYISFVFGEYYDSVAFQSNHFSRNAYWYSAFIKLNFLISLAS